MKNVLIIDDDEIICRLIEKLSGKMGVPATLVKSGEEARSVLKSGKKFDAIFLDLLLPYTNGWDVLSVIMTDPAIKDTPVVIMTGLSLSKEEKRKLLSKAKAVVDKKTFVTEEFEEIMRAVLQDHPAK